MALGVPILKHFRVRSIYYPGNVYALIRLHVFSLAGARASLKFMLKDRFTRKPDQFVH